MYRLLVLLCAFVFLKAQEVPQPKAPGTDVYRSIPVIQPSNSSDNQIQTLPELSLENVAGHVAVRDGSPVLLLKFQSPGAAAVRLHLQDVHLPSGAALFAYSLNGDNSVTRLSGPWTHQDDFWTGTLPGDTAWVEVVWADEVPGDIPFRVTEMERAAGDDPAAAIQSEAGEVKTSVFRGREMTYEVRDGLAVFEGDVILGEAEELEAQHGKTANKYAITVTGARYRWPRGVIPYYIPPGFSKPGRIHQAIEHWNTTMQGLIRFVPRKSETNFVTFIHSTSCASMVGMMGYGAQYVFLADSCSAGNVIHELGHVVGLWHEQSRADRDQHVNVLWGNVQLGQQFNFTQNIQNGDDVGLYDYGSIMHYGNYSFSGNGKPTIETIPPGIPIGQREGLSPGDIAAVRGMYGSSPEVDAAPPGGTVSSPAQATTVRMSFTTNPAGQSVRVDGNTYSTPLSVTWNPGTSHTVEAVNPPSKNGALLQFASWTDGGARVHTVTASSSLTALKADYSVKYPLRTSVSPPGSGYVTISPSSSDNVYPAGTSLSLSAQAGPGYCFSGWKGLLAGTPAQTTVTMTEPLDITAVFQSGTLSLATPIVAAGAVGGVYPVGVSAKSGCSWSAVSRVPWITIVGGASSSGSDVLRLKVDINPTSSSRVGLLTVGTSTLLVIQTPR